MPATTRSKTKPNAGKEPLSKPQSLPQKPPKWNTKAELDRALKDPVSARQSGADLLETLREEQKLELDDALGGEGCTHTHGRGHGRGGHGCGRGRGRRCGCGCGCGRGRGRKRGGEQSDQEMTPVAEDSEVMDGSDTNSPNGDVSCSLVRLVMADSYSPN